MKMDQEMDELMDALNKLFGAVRYELMEAQSNLAMISGKALNRARQSIENEKGQAGA